MLLLSKLLINLDAVLFCVREKRGLRRAPPSGTLRMESGEMLRICEFRHTHTLTQRDLFRVLCALGETYRGVLSVGLVLSLFVAGNVAIFTPVKQRRSQQTNKHPQEALLINGRPNWMDLDFPQVFPTTLLAQPLHTRLIPDG